MKRVLVLHHNDNVANALVDLVAGEVVEVVVPGTEKRGVLVREAIPLGHKIALCPLPLGSHVIKYGLPIGVVTQPIGVGEHVHVHNVE